MTTFTTPEPITTTLDIPAGHVHLTATNRTDTAVEIHPTDPTKNRDVKAAEHATVSYHNGVLRIAASAKTQYFGPSGALHVTVGLPTGSHVQAKAASVEFQTDGQLGEVTLDSDHGRITVDHAATAHLTTVAGDITVARLDGPGEVRTSKGDIRVTHARRGTLTLRTDAGNIDIGAAAGVSASLDAGTSHGRIHNSLHNIDGATPHLTIHATTTVGDITAHSN